MVYTQEHIIPIDEPIPIEPLLVLDTTENSVSFRVLKHDVCKRDVVSSELVKQSLQDFNLIRRK